MLAAILKIRTNFAAVAMETKKGDLKKNWIPFIQLD
jgi:hypothetical protein